MNEEELEALKILKGLEFEEYDWYVKTDKFEGHANEVVEKVEKAMKTILNLIEKQQKEMEKLKDEYKREVFEHQEFVEDTKVAVQDYIKKDKIKEKIEEITSYAYTSAEERDCQDYAIQSLKELLGE